MITERAYQSCSSHHVSVSTAYEVAGLIKMMWWAVMLGRRAAGGLLPEGGDWLEHGHRRGQEAGRRRSRTRHSCARPRLHQPRQALAYILSRT